MTDLVRADPELLDAYATATTTADRSVHTARETYATAWAALRRADATPAVSFPESRSSDLYDLVEELIALDEEPTALAMALRALDTDGDGALTELDGYDAAYVALFLSEWRKDPSADATAIENRTDLLAETGIELIEVVRDDGAGGDTEVYRLNLNDLQVFWGLEHDELGQLLDAYGITGGDGPLHLVVHGFTTDTAGVTSAGEEVANRYDEQGVEDATVLVIDWDSGEGPLDWDRAQVNAARTGTAMGNLLSDIAAADPHREVAVTAHSLGNRVAIRGLTEMNDPLDPETGEKAGFSVDYTAIQPAIPDDGYRTDPDEYGALVDGRIHNLTLSINNGDNALNFYEIIEPTEALGDEASDAEEIQELLARREDAGDTTTIIDHDDQGGGFADEGHLGLRPDDNSLVDWMVDSQIEGITGDADTPLEAAESLVHAMYPDDGGEIWDSGLVQGYLEECEANGVEPNLTVVSQLAQAAPMFK